MIGVSSGVLEVFNELGLAPLVLLCLPLEPQKGLFVVLVVISPLVYDPMHHIGVHHSIRIVVNLVLNLRRILYNSIAVFLVLPEGSLLDLFLYYVPLEVLDP